MKKCFTPKDKLWKVMKLCSIQAVAAMTLCSMAFAHDHYGQVLDKKITITLKEVSIEEALEAIEELTYVKFFYSVDQLGIREKVSVEAVDLSLKEVLDELLRPYKVTYNVHERRSTITLKKHNGDGLRSLSDPRDDKERAAGSSSYSSVLTVEGTVRDAVTLEPIAGVNILIKGTTTGTTTDADGKYRIWAEDNDILVFSFIGYIIFETTVNGRIKIDVTMKEDVQRLKEVVVNAGYWEVSGKERTGNIVKVTAEEIEKQPVQNPLQALQGRVPGLEVTQATGVPGGNFRVRVRGTNSIANGNDPLYVIDGVPYTSTTMAFDETSFGIFGAGTSPLNNINPSDIESIEVLKDADATAIYGSRGANGVILITTKRGQAGKTSVDFRFYRGSGKVASKIELLNTSQYLQMRREAMMNMGIWPLPDAEHQYVPDLFLWDTTRYTNWQEDLIGGTALTTDGQVSVSGGDSHTQFSFGAGYHEEGTVFPGNNFDRRLSTHIQLNNRSQNEKLKTSVTLKYTINGNSLIKRDLTSLALTLPPDAPAIYTENGDLNWGPKTWTQYFPNPLSFTKQGYEASTKSLLINATVSYSILSNMEVKVNLGSSDVSMDAITTIPKSSLAPALAATERNQTIFSNSNFRNWTMEPQLIWKPKVRYGQFEILIGTTFLEQFQEGIAQFAYGFSSEALMKNIGASSTRSTATNYYNQYRYMAGFARVNYKLKEKYILNVTGRRDGSSRFGAERRFANFGAVGMAWIFSEEASFKSWLPFLSFGKLRGSYGITGNDQLGNYEYMDAYASSGIYQGNMALTPARLANPDFGWEDNKKSEAAIEFGLFKSSVTGSISYYHNLSSNQLVGLTLPPTTGFTSVQSNLPAIVQNTGLEIELGTRTMLSPEFNWSTSFNISFPRNKLVEFPNLEATPSYANMLVVGEPLTIAKLYQYVGVDRTSGLYQIQDLNEDGILNSADREATKFIGQEFYGGLSNTFTYKGFQLDILIQFVKQDLRNYLNLFTSLPGGTSNMPAWVMGRWREPGDISDVQLFTISAQGSDAYAGFINSTALISDASYMRLKNLSVSYNLPQEWTKRFAISNADIFILGQNLLTITDFQGLDPETGTNSLPPLKVLSVGCHFTF